MMRPPQKSDMPGHMIQPFMDVLNSNPRNMEPMWAMVVTSICMRWEALLSARSDELQTKTTLLKIFMRILVHLGFRL